MQFIVLENGTRVNAANVISYVKQRNGDARFEMSNGAMISGKPYHDDFEEAFCPVIPAQPGYETIFAREHDGVLIFDSQPVVAWREHPGRLIAIEAFAKRDFEQFVGTKLPDGKYIDIEGNVYSSLDDLEAAYEAELEC